MYWRYIDGHANDNHLDRYAPYLDSANRRIPWERLDLELAAECEWLASHNDRRALSEGFLILKSRLVEPFGAPDNLDREELVNKVFGTSGVPPARVTDEAKRKTYLAMRDLLAGLFKTFRNSYSHSKSNVAPGEAKAVLLMLSYLIEAY